MHEIVEPVRQFFPVSIVIATLGGPSLRGTIERLNESAGGAPAEILICIPEDEAPAVESLAEISNVHVIKTECRGQVAQRAVGLGLAQQSHVMQLDDDVLLPPNALGDLLDALRAKGPNHIVAPFFRDQLSGRDTTIQRQDVKGFFQSCYASIVCGAPFGLNRFGKISPAGIAYGVVALESRERVVETDWLPGGAVLAFQSDLILGNYFPFPGKAFSEDLIHSVLWRQMGKRFWTVLNVYVLVDVTSESFAWTSLVARFRAHQYVARMIGGRAWRTTLWFACFVAMNARRILAVNFPNSSFVDARKSADRKGLA